MSLSTTTTASQCAAILAALEQGRGITPADALREFRCFRLAARVYDLRKNGYAITTYWDGNNDKRWAVYRMNLQWPTSLAEYTEHIEWSEFYDI